MQDKKAVIIDGKMIAKKIEDDLKKKLEKSFQKKVCFVMFGENAASAEFIERKVRMAERLGILVSIYKFSENVETSEACRLVENIVSEGCDGIVVQLPLPSHVDSQAILNCVPPELDIDVLSEEAKGRLMSGRLEKIPPVARAIFEIINFYSITLEGKFILIVGNGKLVGEPVAMTLARQGVPFQVIDKNIPEVEAVKYFKSADIIISGAGSPYLIKSSMIKDGAILIDAGTSEQAGKLVGDIDPACAEKASFLTPVPGGVGPVTVVSLFANMVV